MKIVRYIISGGTALALDLVLLFIFTDILGWWYLWSAIVAFAIAIVVSFVLQKFWTFEDRTADGVHRQFALYIAIALGNTAVNTGLMYVFVDYFKILYLFSQIIASGIIAASSFFIYRRFIFNQNG
jgi:putative flippase GtrA